MEHFRELQKQLLRHDGTPPRQREGKKQVAHEGEEEEETREFWRPRGKQQVAHH
jgi:hypothetical protein